MESARDKRTGEKVDAEELWLLDIVDTSAFLLNRSSDLPC